MPLLTLHSTLKPLHIMPAAVTRPIIEVTRLGDPLPQQETHQTASQGSTIAEYAIKAIADGFRPGVSASEQGSDRTKRGEPASDETRSTVALIPEHSLNEAEVGVSEEYMSLRSAGLSREEALARSDKASMWVDGERVDSRIIQVGALNVCSRFKHANKICQTTAAFNGECMSAPLPDTIAHRARLIRIEGNNDAITALTRFPTATPAPILLVISLAAQLALLLTITCSLIPFSRAAPHIKYRLRSSSNKYRGRAYARYGSHTDSVQQLIDHRPFTRIESEAEDARIPFGLFAYAFVALWLGSFAFGVAGADVLLVLTLEAKNSARVMEEKAVLEAGSYCEFRHHDNPGARDKLT